MYHFCTYFDRRYLVQGLTLFRSLQGQLDDFTLFVLCLDDFTFDALSALGDGRIEPIHLAELERADAALLVAKPTRSLVEYYFTCSPVLPLYILERHPDISAIAYLDADLYFFGDPGVIYRELGEGSILIVEHRFGRHLWDAWAYGVYNVGLVIFRNDCSGRECLEWWRARCLEWCYDRLEAGRFADQKYLDDWPSRFGGVVVLQNAGAGLAPWNWMNYQLELRGDGATVDGQELIFYHFQGMKVTGENSYKSGLVAYQMRMPRTFREWLYGRYFCALRESWEWIASVVPSVEFTQARVRRNAPASWLLMSAVYVHGRFRWWVSLMAPGVAERRRDAACKGRVSRRSALPRAE